MPSTKVLKVTPMNHAEKCPVCSGFGTVGKAKVRCHACDGCGWVIVPNFIDEHLFEYPNNLNLTMGSKNER